MYIDNYYKYMKKTFLVLFTLIISLSWFNPVLAAQDIVSPTLDNNLTVKVGVYDNYPKFIKMNRIMLKDSGRILPIILLKKNIGI